MRRAIETLLIVLSMLAATPIFMAIGVAMAWSCLLDDDEPREGE